MEDTRAYGRMSDEQRAERVHAILYSTEDREDIAERIVALEELVLKNWYITLSEREALRQYKCDEAYISSLDEEIGNAKAEMRELGMELDG